MANQELLQGHPLIVGVVTYMGTRPDSLADHFMVLRGLDLIKGLAYFNDPGRSVANQQYAQDVAYPIGCTDCEGTFLKAWKSQNYAVVIIRPAILVQATLDGQPWLQGSGPESLNYNTYGPQNFIQVDSGVPSMVAGAAPGPYTVSYFSGGPPNSALVALSPCAGPPNPVQASCTTTLGSGADQGITFTFQFTSNPPAAGFTMSSSSSNQSANENGQLNIQTPPGQPATVAFDASRSVAYNSNSIINWLWTANGSIIGSTQTFSALFPVGTYTINLVVTDSRNVQSTAATGTIIVAAAGGTFTNGPVMYYGYGSSSYSGYNIDIGFPLSRIVSVGYYFKKVGSGGGLVSLPISDADVTNGIVHMSCTSTNDLDLSLHPDGDEFLFAFTFDPACVSAAVGNNLFAEGYFDSGPLMVGLSSAIPSYDDVIVVVGQ
jgi:hypothetical protein